MEILEIIQIRTAPDKRALKRLIRRIVNETETVQGLARICIFSNAELETDLSIHLHWRLNRSLRGGSETGLKIVHTLKEYGLVNHNTWIAEE